MTANKLNEKRIKEIFAKTGVLQNGHFVLSSGRHAEQYLQCAQVLQYPQYTSELARGMAQLWSEEEIEVVVGPALGGIIVSFAVGQALNVRAIFAERKEGKMKFRRGFYIKPTTRVLLVEDVVTTGGSVKEVIELLETLDTEIVGISSIVDRSGGTAIFNYSFKPLIQLDIKSYTKDKCKLCQNNVPITKPGSRS